MAKEKKKQHYVPRGYLEGWAIPGKYQVHVYNKKQRRHYPASIYDIASERYFYDIDFTGIFTPDELQKYGIANCDPKHADDEQYIENYLADQIENDFKTRLTQIVNRVNSMTAWETQNCYFLSEVDKFHLSFHLALQHIRVKAVRNSISDMNHCLCQALQDMGAQPEFIDRYTVPDSQLPYIHGKMILDHSAIEEHSQSYFSLTWVLQINKTNKPFFTSDSPIGTEEHLHHPFMSMAGLQCRGVEAYFPIAPNMILLMFDGDYHTFLSGHDRRIIELNNIDDVEYYNSRCLLHCDSCVFSNTPDFSIAEKMLKKDPNAFDLPHTVLHWGGKTYFPCK